LSEVNSGSKATAGGIKGTGVGVGVLVGAGACPDATMVNKTTVVMPPAFAVTVVLPVGRLGTWTGTSKLPIASVLGAGKGRTGAGPMERFVIGEKGGKFLPDTVMNPPVEPRAGIASIDAAGNVWPALEEPGLFMTVTVTLFVEGMSAVRGTTKVVVKAPLVSAVNTLIAVPA
jgi:hypothetical protein